MSISSRCTDCAGSSSTILMTLTSLLSCLVTCSSGRSSTFTTIVIRDTSSCSVGPTARLSILTPRREKRLATRASTPGLFSTSTDSVCLDIVVVPTGRDVASDLDVVVARTSRDHLPHHRVVVYDEVDHDRCVVDGHRSLDRVVDVLTLLAAKADTTHGFGELDEVGQRPAAFEVGVRVALVVEQRLPLPDHAEAAVVDDGHLDRDAFHRAGD